MPITSGKRKDWSSESVTAMSSDSEDGEPSPKKIKVQKEEPKSQKKQKPTKKEDKKKKVAPPSDSSSESSSSESEKETKKSKKAKKSGKDAKKDAKAESSSSESEKETKKSKKEETKPKKSTKEEEKPKKESKESKKEAKESKKEEAKPVKSDKKESKPEKKAKEEPAAPAKSTPAKRTSKATSAEIAEWREAAMLTVDGDECPAPYMNFADGQFPDYIASALTKFEKPTPIQAQGWPLGVAGCDIIGIAETGSGKTLAFGVPAIMHIKSKSAAERKKGPSVVVLAPTRELAQQIEEVMKDACKPAQIGTVCIFGGVEKGPQISALSRGAEIIIATPGRLQDLMLDGHANVSNVSYLVLDEADRMLDMGFHIQINAIIKDIPKKRQTLMYSATWPLDVQKLATMYFRNPTKITIGNTNLSGAKKITQIVEICPPREKEKRLRVLLKKLFVGDCKILIFMLYKKSCENLTQQLKREGWNCESLHGDKSQRDRDSVVANFKNGSVPILLATDVASRGLDIKDIKHVINVEMPLVMEDYVHRIGRTGRAGVVGSAYTLFSSDDNQHTRQLVRIMQESGQKVDDALLKMSENAPVTKPRKSAMEQIYGDYAKNFDSEALNAKPTKKVFALDDD